jgi:hypothetical protein
MAIGFDGDLIYGERKKEDDERKDGWGVGEGSLFSIRYPSAC